MLSFLSFQEVLINLEGHRQTFQLIHRDRSVNGVPVPLEQLQDLAERSDLIFFLGLLAKNVSTHVNLSVIKVPLSTDSIMCPLHLMFT